jgi:hypothetical protein
LETTELRKSLLQEELFARTSIHLAGSEKVVLRDLVHGPASIEKLGRRIEEVHSVIEKGLARPSVVQHDWGLEFSVELTPKGQRLLDGRGLAGQQTHALKPYGEQT